eukprot:m51a1_g301 putative eukaryotic translation initiation factor 4e (215) ;mRNA; f:374233-375313
MAGDQKQAESIELEHGWTLWYFAQPAPGSNADWDKCLNELYTFKFVNEFWSMWNNVPKPSTLSPGSDYYIFKAGVRPVWEDPQNKGGGRWQLVVPRQPQGGFAPAGAFRFGLAAEASAAGAPGAAGRVIDGLWQDTALACVGEQLGDDVCGCAVSSKGSVERLAIWVRGGAEQPRILEIGARWRDLLKVTRPESFEFRMHADTQSHSNSPRFRI